MLIQERRRRSTLYIGHQGQRAFHLWLLLGRAMEGGPTVLWQWRKLCLPVAGEANPPEMKDAAAVYPADAFESEPKGQPHPAMY